MAKIYISQSVNSAYALKSDGTLWAWGNDYVGQLGNGDIPNSLSPTQALVTGVTKIVTGGGGSVWAFKTDGTLWAWGYNYYAQLGDGTNANRGTPVQIIGGVTDFNEYAGTSGALKSDGTVLMWGQNGNGQLGDGTTTNRYTPVPVNNLTGVTKMIVHEYSAFAVKSDGTLWAWGRNGTGELGDGTKTSRSTPVQVKNLTGVVELALDSNSVYALKSDGTAWAWGNNHYGKLGNGKYQYTEYPFPEQIIFPTATPTPNPSNLTIQPLPTTPPASSPSSTSSQNQTATTSPARPPVSVDPNPSHYSAQLVSQSNPQFSVRAGEEMTVEAQFRNTGLATWYQDYTNLGTVETQDRCPGFDTVSGWYKCNRARFLESSVAPGEIATFRMTWKVPANKISYTFHEAFRLVVDEVVWFSEPTVAWDITVLPATGTTVSGPPVDGNPNNYNYEFVSQSSSSQTIRPGQIASFTIKLKNTGTATWYQDYFNLGTTHPQDNVPGFDVNLADRSADGWYKCNRIRFTETQVAPGETATFTFDLTAPSNKVTGTYRYYLQPVVDEVAWVKPDIGMYFEITVE